MRHSIVAACIEHHQHTRRIPVGPRLIPTSEIVPDTFFLGLKESARLRDAGRGGLQLLVGSPAHGTSKLFAKIASGTATLIVPVPRFEFVSPSHAANVKVSPPSNPASG